jgi:ATP-dependent DNA ligase|tara:strand:- start:1040 stop:2137 length:1098 start_codon:yes stop_codon:yes gene_type:complete
MDDRVDLFALDSKKKLRRWSIWSEGNMLCMEYGEVNGEIQENSEPVPFGLANRTEGEQIKMRMRSRINKKLDAGYCRSAQEATSAKRTNLLGYARPMSAVALKALQDVPCGDLFLQNKYNGHRCMIINDAGKNIAYSKSGKIIDSIPEILEEINIPEGVILDGELYHHGTALQTISSWVRKHQDNSKLLTFVCFDAVIEGSFERRYEFLKRLDLNANCKRVVLAPTARLYGKFNVLPLLKKALSEGYEGLMIRQPDSEYLDGQRSKKAIMKVKRRSTGDSFILDDEFLVTNIIPSVDGWGRLVCETEQGVKFTISAPGTHQEKKQILIDKEKYIGKHIRVEFEEYTKSKKPREAVAVSWREKHDE